jgi:hypothetical protein
MADLFGRYRILYTHTLSPLSITVLFFAHTREEACGFPLLSARGPDALFPHQGRGHPRLVSPLAAVQ